MEDTLNVVDAVTTELNPVPVAPLEPVISPAPTSEPVAEVTPSVEAAPVVQTEESPNTSTYKVLTEIVHDFKIWKTGETVVLPTETGDGLVRMGDLEAVTASHVS